jgi:oxygen-independent coproporphyrinogen-3 oxidase
MLEQVIKKAIAKTPVAVAKTPVAMDSKHILGRDRLSLYVNIPFCLNRCKHCCFNTYQASEVDVPQYLKSLQREVAMYSKLPRAASLEFDKVFFGSGTVGILKRDEFLPLMKQLSQGFHIDQDALIGIETTPETATDQKLDDFMKSGVNAIVLGCRSAQQRLCNLIGRKHSVKDSERSIQSAMKRGFKLVAVDLLFDIPTQTLEEHLESLRWAAAYEVHQITVTPLILQKGIPQYDEILLHLLPRQKDTRSRKRMYQRSIDLLTKLGYKQRSLYVFTKPEVNQYFLRGGLVHRGLESPSGFLGFGLAATSYMNGTFHGNTSSLESYNQLVSSSQFPIATGYSLTQREQMIQWLLFSLQAMTVSATSFEDRFGVPIQELVNEVFSEEERRKFLKTRDKDIYLAGEGVLEFGDLLRKNLWPTFRSMATA